MKRYLFICAAFCSLLFVACIKEEGTVRTGTLGRWQWDHSYGGFGPTTITPSANTTIVLNLFEDHTYTIEKNGQQALKDSFTLSSANSIDQIKFKNVVKIDNLHMYPDQIVKIENGKLILSDAISDGMAHHFKSPL